MIHVSTVIPVFNGEATIREAIDSALSQGIENSEVVVCDDGSTDGTFRVLQTFGERIVIVRQRNRGLSAARNAGVAASHGEYVALLDADDVWVADKLKTTLRALDRNPHASLAFSDFIPIDPQGFEQTVSRIGRAPSLQDMLDAPWAILPSCVVLRRTTIERVGGFCEAFKGSGGGDDAYMWLRCREVGEFIYIAKPLIKYRFSKPGNSYQKYVEGGRVFQRLVRERYGDRSRGIERAAQRYLSSLLMASALIELEQGHFLKAIDDIRKAFVESPVNVGLVVSRALSPTKIRQTITNLSLGARRSI